MELEKEVGKRKGFYTRKLAAIDQKTPVFNRCKNK